MKTLKNIMLHNSLGESTAIEKLIEWNPPDGSGRLFLSNSISWFVDDDHIVKEIKEKDRWKVLPDKSGFIIFNDNRYVDNCALINAYGHEWLRLKVPYELTPYEVPPGTKMWFRNISAPFPSGHFGVTAYIEGAGEGDYYFELDYHKGEFLWGKPIRI